MKLFRLPQGGDSSITEADVSVMVAAGTAAGVFDPVERRIVERVFRLDDEPVAAIMTPRTEIVWLDVNDGSDVHYDLIRQHSYARFPVCDGVRSRSRCADRSRSVDCATGGLDPGADRTLPLAASAAVRPGAVAGTRRPRTVSGHGHACRHHH